MCGGYLPTFRNNPSLISSKAKNPEFLTLEERTNRLSRNIGN
jgi:hypothetical protein